MNNRITENIIFLRFSYTLSNTEATLKIEIPFASPWIARVRNQRERARLLYIRIYQSRTESLMYLSLLCRRLSLVYLNTSKEMEMYLDDSSSERKIIWHILKVGISLKLLKPPPCFLAYGVLGAQLEEGGQGRTPGRGWRCDYAPGSAK